MHLGPWGRGGGYFLVKDYWGCADGWSRIFTTALTIMGLITLFLDKKILVRRDLKIGRFAVKK